MTVAEPSYEEKLAGESALWGAEAERAASQTPPDWRDHRDLRHNAIYHRADIDAFLEHIAPGMTALELGCGSGWLTVGMARRGAHAEGIDVSARALDVAGAYAESIGPTVPGWLDYRAGDLNAVELPPARYDVIAIKGTLHHLTRPDHLLDQIHGALKPGGLLWVSDSHGDEPLSTVLAAGALTLILPTAVPYRQKFGALLRFGVRAPERVRASIQAEGLSPFEGAGRDHDWLALLRARFSVERIERSPAITGYVTHQLQAPDALALPFLRALCVADRALVRVGLLGSTGLTIYARRSGQGPGGD